MKKLSTFLLLIPFFLACNNDSAPAEPEGVHDAARTFLENILDGKFDDARKLMIEDDVNKNWLDDTERSYAKMADSTKRSYREAELTIYTTRKLNDSVSVITYSNSYTHRKDSVKVVNNGGKWLIDLKYTFEPDIK